MYPEEKRYVISAAQRCSKQFESNAKKSTTLWRLFIYTFFVVVVVIVVRLSFFGGWCTEVKSHSFIFNHFIPIWSDMWWFVCICSCNRYDQTSVQIFRFGEQTMMVQCIHERKKENRSVDVNYEKCKRHNKQLNGDKTEYIWHSDADAKMF